MENSELIISKLDENIHESLNKSDLNKTQKIPSEIDNNESKNDKTSQIENQSITSPSSPSLSTTNDLNVSSNSEKIHENTESIINIESLKALNKSSSITESTVVITKSQLGLGESFSEKFVQVENSNLNEEDSRNESKDDEVIDSDTSLTDRNDESNVSIDTKHLVDETQDNIQIAQENEVKQVSKQNQSNLDGEVENLENDYEITDSLETDLTNKLNSISNNIQENLEIIDKQEVKEEAKPKRRIEDEVFEKVLGNDSLLKKITQYGDESPSARPLNGHMVTVSYEAYLYNDKENQKLVDHSESLQFILGDGDVISAMDMIVSLMNKNEKCEMITEARHAYGTIGKLPDIPPNSTLLYKIHLINFDGLPEWNQMSPVQRLSLAEAKKTRGNFHYNRQDFEWAIVSYKKGLKYFDEEYLKGDEDEKDLGKFLELSQALLMNLALSNFKLGEYREALDSVDKVLINQSKHVKALYIKGKILLQLGDTKEAINALNMSSQLDPNNTEVKKELAKAQAKHKIQYEKEKKLYQKMISGVSKTEEEQNTKLKARIKNNIKNKNEPSYFAYVATGLVVAAASIGLAVFARYKNII